MATICGARGRTYATRCEWAHHGCEAAVGRREANRRTRTPAPVLPADATEPRGVFPGPQPAPLAAAKH
jgi:hypothetical protein